MSVIALVELPYGYYMLLRLVVCAAAVVIAWKRFAGNSSSVWGVIFAGVALLFNPILPVHFSRELWAVLDSVTAAVFIAYGLFANREGASKP